MRRGDRGRNKSMLQQKNRPCVKSAGPVFLSEKIRRASVLLSLIHIFFDIPQLALGPVVLEEDLAGMV